MSDIYRTNQVIEQPNTLKVGTSSASEISEIIQGEVAVDIPATGAAGAIKSASAAVVGLSTDHRVFVMPQAWIAGQHVIIAAAAGIAGGIQVTATNPDPTVALDPNSQTFSFIAIK